MAAGGFEPAGQTVLLVSVSLIALGLALFIVFHAARGSRRHRSRRMAYLALGLCLITVVPMSLSIGVQTFSALASFDPWVHTFALPMSVRVSEILGLCAMLYSLLLTPSKAT